MTFEITKDNNGGRTSYLEFDCGRKIDLNVEETAEFEAKVRHWLEVAKWMEDTEED
ncbi:MAG: hypothetical protein HGGPFJEG_02376 [Ignavibacteria bacterium]|nr:hypothetical protein [Ignavibacteria bacterium]